MTGLNGCNNEDTVVQQHVPVMYWQCLDTMA